MFQKFIEDNHIDEGLITPIVGRNAIVNLNVIQIFRFRK